MAFWRYILLLGVAVALASCQSLTAPPGFASGGSGTAGRIEFPDGVSLEAQYALLTWYCDEHGAAAERQAAESYGVALNARNECAALLRGNGVRSLTSRYPGFVYVPRQGGIAFRHEILGKRTDFAEMDAMLAACQEALLAPCVIDVPWEECVLFLKSDADAQEVALFQAWCRRNPRLVLAPQGEGVVNTLQACREALVLKEAVLESMSTAQELLQTGDGGCAGLDVLDDVAEKVGSQQNFEIIGDSETLSAFRAMRADAPEKCVKHALSCWKGDLEELDDFEVKLSSVLSIWEKDSRFEMVLEQSSERIHETVAAACEMRANWIVQQARVTDDTKDFWRRIGRANERIAALRSGDAGAWGCYVREGLSDKLISVLSKAVSDMAFSAVGFYRQAQAEAATLTNRQAVAIALDEMLAELEARGKEVTPSGVCFAAQERLGQRGAFYALKIDDFASQVSEVSGKALARDLRLSFAQRLAAWHAEAFLEIVEDAAQADYHLKDGMILEFTGENLVVRVCGDAFRWYGEARLEDTPEGFVLAQDLLEEEIAVKTMTRTGCVRAQGGVFYAGGVMDFSFTDFCRREFVQESAGIPKVVGVVYCGDEQELQSVGGPRELRQERVWSVAEMMDCCRQRALESFPEQLLSQILDAEYALCTSVENPLDRAERLGELLYALQHCVFPGGSELEEKRLKYLAVLPGEVRQLVVIGLTAESVAK